MGSLWTQKLQDHGGTVEKVHLANHDQHDALGDSKGVGDERHGRVEAGSKEQQQAVQAPACELSLQKGKTD